MINLYYLCPSDSKRLWRMVFLMLSAGVITILCHTGTSFSNGHDNGLRHGYFEKLPGCEAAFSDKAFAGDDPGTLTDEEDVWGPAPEALDDTANTAEETPVVIAILANDKEGNAGDDNEDFGIDPATVDLDPGGDGIQASRSTEEGSYAVDNSGYVTFTPALDFFGNTSVQYTVDSKAGETSNRATLSITVTNVNDAPVVGGWRQGPPEAHAGKPFTIGIGDLAITDPDDQAPDEFSMTVLPGDHYTLSGNTVTPQPGFSGSLSINVQVNDGFASSEPFALSLQVTQENVKPEITGQNPNPLTTEEDQAITITPGQLQVADPDDTYPGDFTIKATEGANYSVSGLVVTPSENFTGTLSVPVTVNDGETDSEPYNLQISVTPVNDPPVITGQQPDPLSTGQDQPLTITVSHLVVDDPDNNFPADFSITVLDGENYTVSGNSIVPAGGFSGLLEVNVTASDLQATSGPYPLNVNVADNSAPVITGQVPLNTNEETSIAIGFSHLTVEDPDDDYPTGFTLSVLGGDHYSVAGNQVTPAPDFNGDLTVQVFVDDGTENSAFFDLVITVNPVNDPPAITSQRPLEMNEGTSIILSVQDLMITDPDDLYPDDFTLSVQSGENYIFSGTAVTPSPDFTGTLSVNVGVNDGTNSSAPFTLRISVVPLNDAPQIAGQQTVTTPEDVSRTISMADLVVTDPDNSFPSGFTLLVFSGENYTLSESTVLPVQDFHGTLTVPVQVSDGALTSNVFNLQLVVTPVNDPPVITGQALVQTQEDTPVTIRLSDLTVLDVDNSYPAGFTLLISSGLNYSFTGAVVTPVLDFNGTLNVNVMVNDGTNNSASFVFQIQVANANDAPVITGQHPLSTNEENPVTLELAHLTVTDPDNVYPAGFSLFVSPGINYTVSDRTVTPAVHFTGTLTIPVRVNDGVNNSHTFNFQLQVNQVNDAPAFAPIANLQVEENAPAGSINITDISKGPMEDDQQLTFVATSGNTSVVEDPVIQYNGAGATAVLSYVVQPNASGVVTITVVAIDNGSGVPPHQNSYSANFQIEVLEINSAPALDAISNMTILEDAEQQNVALSGISAGPGETQALTVAVTSGKPEYFDLLEVAYTSPATTGLLQFKPKSNISGTVQFSVTVTDNGSGVSPHVNSITMTFTVTIQPVNDPPVFTSTPVAIAAINEEYEYRVTAADPDGEQITVTAPSKPSWASLAAVTNGVAILRGRPPAGSAGNTPVTLQLRDAASAVEQSFNIYVNVRPVLASLTMVTEEDIHVAVPAGIFESGYTDANDNALAAVKVTALPASGKLLLSGVEVKAGDTIQASTLSGLRYAPNENFFGVDFFGWNAFDGYQFSLAGARVDISVLSMNDAPTIHFQHDTLHYEVNGEPDFVSPLVDIRDPDDDTLTRAVVGFHARNYHPDVDRLEFQNTPGIRGTFDFQSGILQLTGIASVAEYRNALRSIRYLHQNTIDPLLEPKAIYFTVHDGETESAPKDKVIMLQYTFIEFEIPSGFTPNGDQANDTWVIDRPGGGLEEMDNAIISVYNKQGVLVFRSKGFDRHWDGTMNGELLPADSYFFTIDLQLRNKKTYKGIVTILR